MSSRSARWESGHPTKVHGAVRAWLEDSYQHHPRTPGSTVQARLEEQDAMRFLSSSPAPLSCGARFTLDGPSRLSILSQRRVSCSDLTQDGLMLMLQLFHQPENERVLMVQMLQDVADFFLPFDIHVVVLLSSQAIFSRLPILADHHEGR